MMNMNQDISLAGSEELNMNELIESDINVGNWPILKIHCPTDLSLSSNYFNPQKWANV